MAKQLLYIVIFFSIIQWLPAQDDGVVALSLPVRNSLKFNTYAVNPTFSFVRAPQQYISFTNKRSWVQFDNAPQTYLFSYSGRIAENSGAAIGLFQQNYGVLTTFGGVLNYAQNVVLNRDSNLTFGLNLGAYQSGLNEGAVITNFPDPSLQNIPNHLLLTIAPGINYGTTFFDVGVSLPNLVTYNLKTSQIIEDNPEQSIQAHVMYTGYVESRGFFDRSKFSTLIRSEFKKEQTVISGIMMLAVPKGIWGQAGYNTLYGVSAGIGINITSQIAIEYNFEKEIGTMASFGNSHDITLAYKFNTNRRYNYDEEEEDALFSSFKGNKKVLAKDVASTKVDREAIAEAKAAARAEALAKQAAKRAERLKAIEDAKATQEANAQAKTADLNQKQAEAAEAARIKLEEETKAQAQAEEALREKQAEDAKAKAAAAEAARIKLEEEAKAKAQAEEALRVKQAEDAKAKAAAAEAARIKLEEEAKAKAQAEEALRVKQAEDAKAKEAAAEAARIKLEEEAKAKAEAIKEETLDGVLISKPTDALGLEMSDLAKIATESKLAQDALLLKLNETVASRDKDLNDLKQENDLSEQGIYTEPKPFKSVSAENAALESLKSDLDQVIQLQDTQIGKLENLYKERLKSVPDTEDAVNMIYLKEILILKEAQTKAKRTKESLVSQLETIKVATEFERKRRIKRAEYDNEQDRYNKDRASLNAIKQFTEPSTVPLKAEDFDFGEEQTDNIQIIKDVRNVDTGYYLVIAVHSDAEKRDAFLRKAVAAGQQNIDFFFDVATNKYYIYYQKFDDISNARNAMQAKGSTPYNGNMSMVKIE